VNTLNIIRTATIAASFAAVCGLMAAPASAQSNKSKKKMRSVHSMQCSTAGIASLGKHIQLAKKRRTNPKIVASAMYRHGIAKRAMAEKDRALCSVALRSGRSILARANRPTGAGAAARYCTPANFKKLNSMIQAGVKKKSDARAIRSARLRYSAATKAGNMSACGGYLKNGMDNMNRALRAKK
jgi:hypothetical protein